VPPAVCRASSGNDRCQVALKAKEVANSTDRPEVELRRAAVTGEEGVEEYGAVGDHG
jgi:hypothetical protein